LLVIKALIMATQVLIFFMVMGSQSPEVMYLSILPIISYSFFFKELHGLFFALIVSLCFSPFLIDIGTNPALWGIRASCFLFVALTFGRLSRVLEFQFYKERKQRFIDSLTEMPNRQALCRDLQMLTKNETKGRFIIAVVFISNRKRLSETFGIDVTKSVFRQLSNRGKELSKKISCNVEIFSLSPDQIAFLFKKHENCDFASKEELENILTDISKNSFLHKGFFLHSDTRVGFYRFTDFTGINQNETPLLCAEKAMDTAVNQMKDMVIYNPLGHEQNSAIAQTPDILGEIDLAIRSRWMFLVYQPKIDLATGKVRSVEALIRWKHPTKGFVPPNVFIPQAEQSTLIENITEFVIRQAILHLKLWQRSGVNVTIAVNVSSFNLLQPDFVNKVLYWLQEHNLPPESLEIEITEGALIADFQHVLDGLKRFRDTQIKIALDDFGTGYSSLQYLQKLPIDYLKIDQSFIRNLGVGKESKEIVKAIVHLAHSLNIKTIAEGIETLEDYEYLNSVNCDIGQGFYMSKPLTSNTFVSWYSENNGVFKS